MYGKSEATVKKLKKRKSHKSLSELLVDKFAVPPLNASKTLQSLSTKYSYKQCRYSLFHQFISNLFTFEKRGKKFCKEFFLNELVVPHNT